jgi:hypothetical protein
MARDFAEQVVRPLFDFLDEQIGDGSSVLYALERYVRQVEWFDQQRLYDEFQANTRQGEDVYDRHLREFLFREGFDMPYSQLHSPSGQSDVLAGLESDDPLVCELKVYDGENRDIGHVASGVTQALQYARDHGKAAAHLVIINLTTRPLQLPSDGPEKAYPPYLDLPGARVYLIQVRGLPRESASRQGRTEPLIVQRAQLVGDLAIGGPTRRDAKPSDGLPSGSMKQCRPYWTHRLRMPCICFGSSHSATIRPQASGHAGSGSSSSYGVRTATPRRFCKACQPGAMATVPFGSVPTARCQTTPTRSR